MTPQTPTQPDRMTAGEIREAFAHILTRIDQLENQIISMREGLHTAASAPATQTGTFGEMMIDTIAMSYDDTGKPVYKAKGAPYMKHGVRIWEEVLPLLGIDAASLKPGPNPQTPAIKARVLMNTPEEGKTAQPRKVTGKA